MPNSIYRALLRVQENLVSMAVVGRLSLRLTILIPPLSKMAELKAGGQLLDDPFVPESHDVRTTGFGGALQLLYYC